MSLKLLAVKEREKKKKKEKNDSLEVKRKPSFLAVSKCNLKTM